MPRCEYSGPRQRDWWRGTIVLFHHNLLNSSGVCWLHGGPGGRILLKDEVSWRNINGILIRTPRHQLFLHFRRRPSYLGKRR